MKTTGRSFVRVFLAAAAVVLFSLAQAGAAEEEKKPEFKGAVYFGGSGNQGAAQDGMGLAVAGKDLYVSGADLTLFGGQALAACYALPPGSSPEWTLRWPNMKASGWWNEETFPSVAVTDEGVYCAGRSWVQTTDGVGDREGKAVLVKFPLNGATGAAVGGALWVAKPLFFPYTGIETFIGVAAVKEGGSTFLYATGRGQSDGSNNTAVLAKFDTAGRVLWTKVLGRAEPYVWSQGDTVAALNGFVYVAGYTHWHKYTSTIRPHAGLWKVDPSGNVVWFRESPQPLWQNSLAPISVVASGGFLHLSAAQEKGPNGGVDLLVLKYDEAGNLLSSWNWGGSGDEAPHGIELAGSRLYIVGETTGWVGGGKDVFLVVADAAEGKVLSVDYHGGKYDDIAYGAKVVGTDLYIVGDSKSALEGGNLEGQSDLVLLRYTLSGAVPVLDVSIDIRPESFPNPVNPKSQGNLPVAILSTAAFDAPALVDRGTLTFGRTGLEKSLVSVKKCVKEDVNADGRLDLLCHFDTQPCAFQAGDTRGLLMGKTVKGRPFVGSDSVVIVPVKKGGEDEEKWKKEKHKESEQFKPPAQKSQKGTGQSGPVPHPASEADGLKRGEIGY